MRAVHYVFLSILSEILLVISNTGKEFEKVHVLSCNDFFP